MSQLISATQPEYKQNLIHKHTSKASLRGKVDAKCIECIQNGTWRKQAEECTSSMRTLYQTRPKSSTKDKKVS
jgi:hypothetical protein